MVDIATVGRAFGGLALLLSNAFFVTTEFAMTRVRQFDESEFQGSAGLERAWEMTDKLEIYLSGCQVGITISSVGLGVVAEPAVAALLTPAFEAVGLASPGPEGHATIAVVTSLAIINLMHVIVGEQVPTYFGVERTRTAAKYGAPVLYWWAWVMSPVIRVADWSAKALLGLFGVSITRSWAEEELEEGDERAIISRGDLFRQMGDVLSQGSLSAERRQEVMNALALGELSVEEVMVPLDDVVSLRTDDDTETNLDKMREQPHTRFPLVGADFEEYHGAVYAPQVLQHIDALEAGEMTFEDLSNAPMTLTAETSLSDAIDQFQVVREELAVVMKDGEPVGLLTPTDAWEAITGELEDPLDEQTAAA